MKDPIPHGRESRASSASRRYMIAVAAVSLAAIISTFAISVYSSEIGAKARGFVVILIAYVIACVGLYRAHARREPLFDGEENAGSADIDAHLKILDEAREFFAGSLKTSDTFRLVVSRIGQIVRFNGVSLLVLDDKREAFVVAQTDGAADEKGTKLGLQSGVTGRCYSERDVIVDQPARTAAVPLKRDAEVFGILLLHFAGEDEVSYADPSVLDAIGERVAPLVLASIARDRSQENALTDATTDLPNERAFHLVLENQVAEAVRKGSSRPLTILSFDINDFDNINSRYGHAAGDRILNFVAQCAKDTLRQMDFFAKGSADEFLAIMPTASKEVSHEIVARIQTALFGRKIKVSEVDSLELELNFGWASFGLDGETPSALIAVARERKEQIRTGASGSVLWFPQEIAH
ncbi:MAG: GGDEF domain-containing protein [Acidobacteria bacterium]|nr:GGDEF domain-containing protein [Acidobacteriota bacterium]